MPYTAVMRKTSVYLSDEDSELLAQLAEAEDRSKAEIVRDAIRNYRSPTVPDRDFKLVGCVRGDGTPFTQETADELMRKGFGR
jgi:hypothetical protein